MTNLDTPNSPQRRISPRLSVQLAARLLPLVPDPRFPPFLCATLSDLSIGGCQLLVDRAVPKDSQWALAFENGVDQPANTPIRVARCVEQDGNTWIIGCTFSDLAPLIRAAQLGDQEPSATVDKAQSMHARTQAARFDIRFKVSTQIDTATGISIRADRDLTVLTSATHCTLDIAGSLSAPKAKVSGGRFHFRAPSTIGTLGSPDHTSTLVSLGRSLSATLLLAAAPSMLQGPTAELAARNRTIEACNSGTSGTLSAAERENLTIAISEARDIEKQIERINTNIRSIKNLDVKPAMIRLEITETLHPGVILTYGDQVVRIDQAVAGPLTIVIDADGRIAMMTPDTMAPKFFSTSNAAA